MERKKICLFSALPPLGGGGSVTLRSLITNISDIEFFWKYTTDGAAQGFEQGYIGRGLMGGNVISDVYQTWQMLTGKPIKKIDEIVSCLLKVECDGYWIISHNEGLRIALEISRVQKKRPVHMSIHDDWAGALCARSLRYRSLSGIAHKMTISALKEVSSFDVTSRGMQTYYKEISGRNSEVTHRYISSDMIDTKTKPQDNNVEMISVGHIGSLYNEKEFITFLSLIHEFGKLKGLNTMVNMWGYKPKMSIPNHLRNGVQFHPTLPENKVVQELSQCNFLYAMYPKEKRFRVFRRTSMQTKLASYIRAGRPIFGQSPQDSSLAEFLNATRTGILWSCGRKRVAFDNFTQLLNISSAPDTWEYARQRYFGEENLDVIHRALLA